ncbi:MAG: hypothetical protein IJ766_03875 [Clostridia bacterium]|nr:hypothetical protein [Clostridia bacterium]
MPKSPTSGLRAFKGMRAMILYTVYDNKTDLPVIVDGTASEAANVMGITVNGLYTAVCRQNNHELRRWTILKRTRRPRPAAR